MSNVLLATCADLPTGDDDEDSLLLVAACERAGLEVGWAVWDDPSVSWSDAELVVVRTTWDYTDRREAFLAWAAGLSVVANPHAVLAWNSDKVYLRELADEGVAVVPTAWAAPGEDVELPAGRDYVVKPSVGAGSMGAGRFSATDPDAHSAAREHIAHLHRLGRTAMVQPYLDGIDQAGETALIFIDGAYSHAIRKAPMLPEAVVHTVERGSTHGLFVAERITPREPSAAELAVAEQVLSCAALRRVVGGAGLLYTRVDLVPTPDGPVLIELELTEPSLFLRHHPGSVDRFARAIAARVGRA